MRLWQSLPRDLWFIPGQRKRRQCLVWSLRLTRLTGGGQTASTTDSSLSALLMWPHNKYRRWQAGENRMHSFWFSSKNYKYIITYVHIYISEYCHLSLMETAHSQWLCATVGGLEPLLRTWRQCLDWNLNCLTSMKIHSSILNEELKYWIGVDYEQNMSIHFWIFNNCIVFWIDAFA